jgi:hypothetical protein
MEKEQMDSVYRFLCGFVMEGRHCRLAQDLQVRFASFKERQKTSHREKKNNVTYGSAFLRVISFADRADLWLFH